MRKLEAEQSLLGALMLNNDGIALVDHFLAPGDFSEALHSDIYRAMLQLSDRGGIPNPTTIAGHDPDLPRDYLRKLACGAVTIVNVVDLGRLIHEPAA